MWVLMMIAIKTEAHNIQTAIQLFSKTILNNNHLNLEHGVMILALSLMRMLGFVLQNVNGITSSTGVHEALKSKMVALGGTVTALAETNVNWQNFNFHDKWETLMQQSYASLHFSHSSCDEGTQQSCNVVG